MQVLSNNPPVTMEFDRETAEFILKNAETNIDYGFRALQVVKARENAEVLVSQIESFKRIREIAKEALK